MLGHLFIFFVMPITPIPESPRPDFHTEHPFVEFGSPRCSWTRTSYLTLEGMPPDLKIASHNVINDASELSTVDLPYTSTQSEHPFQFSLFSTNDNLMDLNGPTRFPILHRELLPSQRQQRLDCGGYPTPVYSTASLCQG